MMTLDLNTDVALVAHVPDEALIRRFKVKTKGKLRDVNDPTPVLKDVLKRWNDVVTLYYVDALERHGVADVAHAYLPNRSIQTNARAHRQSSLIQFDFKGFYDTCRFEYFREHLFALDPTFDPSDEDDLRRLLIDPKTNGVTQGLPVSGALAGLSLIPFWVALKTKLPANVRFTQYSDDLTFSFTGVMPDLFNIPDLTALIETTLDELGLDFVLNTKKTRSQSHQYRKVTGIRINDRNQMTPSRVDYRFLRHALFILSKSDNLDEELARWGFKSKEAFVGKVSYIRSIDDTGKINRLILRYAVTCRKHNLFTTWIDQHYKANAFA